MIKMTIKLQFMTTLITSFKYFQFLELGHLGKLLNDTITRISNLLQLK